MKALAGSIALGGALSYTPLPYTVMDEQKFGAMVGGRHKVPRALHRHLQMLDLSEVTFEATAGAMRRLDHDIEDRGMLHGRLW